MAAARALASPARPVGVIVTVDPRSPVPPYEQLRTAITRLVATGQLPVGSRLPTVRQLAADLALAPGTVARAFRELESDGVVVTRGRHGTYVSALPPRPRPAERDRRLREAAAAFAAAAGELGVDTNTAVDYIKDALGSTTA